MGPIGKQMQLEGLENLMVKTYRALRAPSLDGPLREATRPLENATHRNGWRTRKTGTAKTTIHVVGPSGRKTSMVFASRHKAECKRQNFEWLEDLMLAGFRERVVSLRPEFLN
jgi:hypothetical protein